MREASKITKLEEFILIPLIGISIGLGMFLYYWYFFKNIGIALVVALYISAISCKGFCDVVEGRR